MTTAEKRAELEAREESWPVCECHGQRMWWRADKRVPAGGHFHCPVQKRDRDRAMRDHRRKAGVCVYCGSPDLATSRACGHCRSINRQAELRLNDKPLRQIRRAGYARQRRARDRAQEGFQSTTTGQAAIAAAMAKRAQPTGEV